MSRPVAASLLSAILLAGLFLRCHRLGERGFWLDENYSAEISAGHGFGHFDLPTNRLISSPPDLQSLSADEPWWHILTEQGRDVHPPLYFVATDEVIALLNEEKMTEAIARIAALATPPSFEDADIYGISHGSKKFADARAKTTIKTEGDTCTYLYSHESGHFTKLVWKKGVGLVEYAQGYGAHQDGFRLKRR